MGCGGSKGASVVDANQKTEENTKTTEKPKEPVKNDETERKTVKEDNKKSGTENVAKEADKTFKIVIVGDERSGKTCISTRFVRDEFIDMYLPTLGAESKTKVLNIDGKMAKFQILDTSGNERYELFKAATKFR